MIFIDETKAIKNSQVIYEEISNKIILLRISLDRMRKIISNCRRILKTLHNTSLSIGNNFL